MALPLVVMLAVGFEDGKPAAAGPMNPQLREELLARAKKEQEIRFRGVEAMSAGKGIPAADAAALAAVDKDNREWLKGVVGKHGWPGKSLVGRDGTGAAWLLVQHADPDVPFQKQCLALLTAAVKAGEAEGKDLAYLTDRVLGNEGKKQVYGTQLVEKGGRFVPKPIEDEAKVDERRKGVGMPPLAEYIKSTEEMYKLKPSSPAPAAKKP